ncbi:MAG TPA: response regulator [Bacteroidales bacterium]|nr:response regulator [Bacteroidales bacterium]
MLRRFKIGNRLVIGYTVLLCLSIMSSVISVFEINNIWNDTKNLYEKPYTAMGLIKDIKINVLNIRRYMLDITLLGKADEIDKLVKLIDDEEVQTLDHFNELEKLYPDSDLGLQESQRFFSSWKPLRDEVIELSRNGDEKESSAIMITRNREFVISLFEKLDPPAQKITDLAYEFYNTSRQEKNKILVSLLVILLASLITSVLFAYLITRSISIPLKEIVFNIREIAKGNLNNNILKVASDEIGELAGSYNMMQGDLMQKAIIAQRIARGEFSARVKAGSENDVLAESINMIANNFDQVVKQAAKVADGDYNTQISGISGTNPLTSVINRMLESLREVVANASRISQGDFSGEIIPKSASDELAVALNRMTAALRDATEENARQSRLKTAQNELNEQMRGDLQTDVLARNVITFVSKYTRAQLGALYLYSPEQNGFQLKGSYAFTYRKGISTFYKEGEGLVGQAALEKQVISFNELPDNYVRITSGLGDTVPRNVIIAPFIYENTTLGVIELGSVTQFSDEALSFLDLVLENIAVSVMSAESRTQMTKLLEVTKSQAEELQVQQEELRQTNEELESQTVALKKSEESLQSQQEELRVTNEELEDKTKRLEEHKDWMEKQNRNLEQARADLERKARELEVTNRYKSEFLANMSHELRTPLNSLLLLSQALMENKPGNLNEQQVESARIIYNSGNDLLNLINDILDLSRIESGKMTLNISTVTLDSVKSSIKDYFAFTIKEKGLDFSISIENNVPQQIISDEQRLNQILRNIMSNAVKFTEKGSIKLRIFKPGVPENAENENMIAFSVRDTGIGIPENRQKDIFEAFQQVDGSISRKYAGSGLGLSITRELIKLLGGRIELSSEPGKGSEFTVIIPVTIKEDPQSAQPKTQKTIVAETVSKYQSENKDTQKAREKKNGILSIPDDRDKIKSDSSVILIIEDDEKFAGLLAGICRDKGFLCIVTATGEEGLEMTGIYKPKGIILDINLPGMSGWDVLDNLKNSSETRHIPVHIISGYEETLEAYSKGAVGYLTKPVTRDKIEAALGQLQSLMPAVIKNLLIIEDDQNLRKSIRLLLDAHDIRITEANTGQKAIAFISENHFDCIVLDLGLPDMTGFDMLRILKEKNIRVPPVVVYTGKELTREENAELQHYTQNIIIKGVKSEERLLDETTLFLHRVVKDMPERQKKILINLYDKEEMFRGKKIMIVDDDMRNVFAIKGVLETGHMKVLSAADGKKALNVLEKNTDTDLILMDIMMPEMDGYETVRQIRKNKRLKSIPIIMLTAKAMKEDREKSLEAGANDYLSKPVDIEKLLNLMRIWLYQ